MAQMILSNVGEMLGSQLPGAWSSIGSVIGQAGGSLLGQAIDRRIFGSSHTYEGARLTDLHIQGSTEGASIPAVYGSVRIAGQVIWAARFKEHTATEEVGGGKGGGPSNKSRTYNYTLSFAVGLCEGMISRIGRVWANGEQLDLSQVAYRVHTGREDQAPDFLIEAIDGAENAPAYRGLAYVVFEDLPLENYGNTIPQLSFEVIRPAPAADGEVRFEERIKAVCLIPGAGEFVYATEPVFRYSGPGQEVAENVHAERDRANLLVSLDQLAADLPNCETVMLVVAWFGDDLRCGECQIRPGVEIAAKQNTPHAWHGGDVERAAARLISQHDGAPAFGGTPSDRSVLQAIAELKLRGYKVGLYPFLMMDIPVGNALPDPYGGDSQAAYPWRGRITVAPAAGQPSSADQTSAASEQIDAFFGTAEPSDFGAVTQGSPTYTGPSEWSYRRFILHNAKLAAEAGVDVFVIGSELRGLTTARDSATTFPTVAAMQSLASDVRSMLGVETTITYAADWSEYLGHQPQDGSGDVLFHLDPLWADDNIDVVGIDWYPPLSDWRAGATHLEAETTSSIYVPDYLQSRIEGGEAFEWYYVSPEDRDAQVRTPITDGAHEEAWIYRAKDVRSFWSNAHHNRPGGVRDSDPTVWAPESKPIWLMELGCPAIDKGANEPNVFIDAKSSENAEPHYSTGARDDLIQRRTLEAYLRHWDVDSDANPLPSLTGKPMIEQVTLWAWDARPYPAFPARADVWADGASWRRGHWLTGRAGLSSLDDVVRALCARADVDDINASGLTGAVSGYVIDSPAMARDALEPLMAAYDFSVAERDGDLIFFHRVLQAPSELDVSALTADVVAEPFAQRDAGEAPIEARVRFLDAARDYLIAGVSARRLDRADGGVATLEAPLVLEPDVAEALAQRALADLRAASEALHLSVGPAQLALEAGDRIVFGVSDDTFEIGRIEDVGARRLELHRVRRDGAAIVGVADPSPPTTPTTAPTPAFSVLDLPPLPGHEEDDRPLIGLLASPWLGEHQVYAGATTSLRARVTSAAVMGELLWQLWPGPVDRWDEGNRFRIKLYGGVLSSAARDDVLNGANAFAIESDGEWEIVQAAQCVLVAAGEYELETLLRGRLGSSHAMQTPHPVGARIIKLDERLVRAEIGAHEWQEPLTFVAPPCGAPESSNRAASLSATLPHSALRPWAPAHLRAAVGEDGDVSITWVRCARIGGDVWGPGEPSLGAPTEGYVVDILDGDDVVRSEAVSVPSFLYSVTDQTTDFGAPPASLHIRVAQLGESGATGLNSELTITL